MPIYKQDASGNFVPFEETPFPDLEKVLENWIERNPHIILDGEDIAIFARQPRTTYNKSLDLLGVDKTGATVIIELKRGETPRDVVAQTLEYAAWVDTLTSEELDDLARNYQGPDQPSVNDLAELYSHKFPSDGENGDEDLGAAQRVTFNNRQRLVIVAERISDEVAQTLRYLRTQYGVDLHGVQFSVHKAGNDTIISTNTVVGQERAVQKTGQGWQKREAESDEALLERMQTDFMRQAVTSIEEWVGGLATESLRIEHSSASDHRIKHLGVTWTYYYYATSWLYMILYFPTDDEFETLRTGLSKPAELRKQGKNYRFHIANESDLELMKQLVLKRLDAQKQDVAAS